MKSSTKIQLKTQSEFIRFQPFVYRADIAPDSTGDLPGWWVLVRYESEFDNFICCHCFLNGFVVGTERFQTVPETDFVNAMTKGWIDRAIADGWHLIENPEY